MVAISDWNDLDAVRNDLTGSYTLANDLDSSTAGYTGIGDDWTPLGFVSGNREGNPFSGTLNGQGYKISDLVIEENNSAEGGVAFITQVGSGGLVENLSVAGTVDSTIADFFYGGLAGSVAQGGVSGTVQNCVSHIDVTALSGERCGGLVGQSKDTIKDSYSTGSVDADASVGGLIGSVFSGTIQTSYAVGSVTGNSSVGGLAGFHNGTLTNCYASGSVDGDDGVGGLVGNNSDTIQTSYAVGSVTGNTDVGGLVGFDNAATVTDSYWDTQSSGQSTSGGGTGLTTSEMQGQEASTNMGGFDFTNDWNTVLTEDSDTTADGYPILLALDRQNQLEAQGIYQSLVIVNESGQASAIATGSGTETTSATEVSSVTATASPLSIETGRATEAGATAATATPAAIETGGSVESGQATATATSAGTETARATETGSLTAVATPAVIETAGTGNAELGRVTATGTLSSTETTSAIETGTVTPTVSIAGVETTDASETGGITASATGAGVETTTAIESGTTNVRASPSTVEAIRASETGSIITQASLAVTSTAGVTVVRVAPRRTLDQQLRAIGRVLDLNEP